MSQYVDFEEFNALKALVNRLTLKVSEMETELKEVKTENLEVKAELSETKMLLDASLKRTFRIEKAIFSLDSDGDIILDDEENPVLSVTTEKPTEEKVDESPIIPQTTLELKAAGLLTHLLEAVKPGWSGQTYMNTQEFYDFMKNTISEKLRWKQDLSNPRDAKKEIFKKAVKMYPNLLEIVRNKSGNKVTGIALKTSVKCRDTYGC